VKEKDVLLTSTRAKLESLQADHCASDDTVSGLEELLVDKDKQIERSATRSRFLALPCIVCGTHTSI